MGWGKHREWKWIRHAAGAAHGKGIAVIFLGIIYKALIKLYTSFKIDMELQCS